MAENHTKTDSSCKWTVGMSRRNYQSMIQLPFPSTIEAQPRNVTFLTIQTVVRKIQKNDGQTGSCAWTRQCLDRGGGGQN